MTIEFYKAKAAEYAANENPPNPRLFGFLSRCKPGGGILELGTGGGVDAKAILDAGFRLDATDGSAELAAIASIRIGQPVRPMMFDELCATQHYGGIYACAALTHVPRAELGAVIGKIHAALVDGGLVWASFKTGTAEGDDGLGRYYNYLSADELVACWRDNGPWAELEVECWQGGAYDRRPTNWAAITAVRPRMPAP
ncbi:class I SAM-dependent methyltransferase [Pleomorphomonas sp. PLEO]|uniref:class I SAM-dependent methyltransferase n=1 Tax=Pleomorphomonas sp. PLEO TaxID=3239306 RepID=UPI00351F1726